MWKFYLWFKEAFYGIFRNFTLNFFATSLSFISLFILAFWVIIGVNVQHTTDSVESSVQITLNLKDEITDYVGVSEKIESLEGVDGYLFIDKDEAFELMKKDLGDREYMLTELGFNPLPASFQIRVTNPEDLKLIAKKIESWGIDKSIKYGENYIEKLLNLTGKVEKIGIIVLFIMVVSSGVMVYVSIRMNILNRNKELEIKDLVGAGKFNIRIPFLIEGILLTMGSALIVIVLTYLFYDSFTVRVFKGYDVNSFASLETVMTSLVPVILIVSGSIGVIGSFLSTQRYLKRH